MLLDAPTARQMVDEAVSAVSSEPDNFHAVLDRLPAPIYVTDNDGIITYFNNACVALAGSFKANADCANRTSEPRLVRVRGYGRGSPSIRRPRHSREPTRKQSDDPAS